MRLRSHVPSLAPTRRRVAFVAGIGGLLVAVALAPVGTVGAGTSGRDPMTGLIGIPRGWTLRLAAVNTNTGAEAPTCEVTFQVRSANGVRLANQLVQVEPLDGRFFDFRPATGFGRDDRLEAYGIIVIGGTPDPSCATMLVPSAEVYDPGSGIGETFVIVHWATS